MWLTLSWGALLALSVAVSGSLPAGTFTVSPISILLAHGQPSASINVTNSHLDPMSVQVRIYRWTQDGDKDVLAPTSDVILSPPMATIPSGAVQTLRVLMRPRPAAEANQERHYRILLDEIPGVATRPGQLSFAMRASMPVFVTPEQPITPALQWRATRGPDDTVVLTVINTGLAYDRVMALTATMSDGAIVNAVPRGTNSYVLPGSQRQWVVHGKVISGTINLDITTRTGRLKPTVLITQ